MNCKNLQRMLYYPDACIPIFGKDYLLYFIIITASTDLCQLCKTSSGQHQHGSDVICVGAGFTGSVLGFQDGQLRRTNLNAKIAKNTNVIPLSFSST